jgi:hypothetical protein
MTLITYDYSLLKVVKPDAAYQKGQRPQRTAVSLPLFYQIINTEDIFLVLLRHSK